jgi:F0F1-type ATP synthase membrane subunit b/b'
MNTAIEIPASSRSTFVPVALELPTLSERTEEIKRQARASVAAELDEVLARARAEVAAQRAAREAELARASSRADRSTRRTGVAVALAALLVVATTSYVTHALLASPTASAPAAQKR